MSIYGGPFTPENGLVLHYDAHNPKCYSGTGNLIYDLSGYNNTGSLVNVSLSGSTVGNVFALNRLSTAYIECGSGSALVTSTAQSLNVWISPITVNPESIIMTRCTENVTNNTDWRFMSCIYNLGAGTAWGYRSTPNAASIERGEINSGIALSTSGVWYMLTVTHYGNASPGYEVRLYTNGQFNLTDGNTNELTSTTFNGATLKIGRGIGGAQEFFNGYVGMVSMFNRILTPYEVSQMYESTRSRFQK
jgi:hypothetical protein